MDRRYIFIAAVAGLILGCSKSNNSSHPSIKVSSISDIVPEQGNFTATIEFTQKNGKLANGTFIAIRQRINQKPVPPDQQIVDTNVSVIPDFPDKSKGQFEFTLPYNFIHEDNGENDTLSYKFIVVDLLGDSSNAVITKPFVVLQ